MCCPSLLEIFQISLQFFQVSKLLRLLSTQKKFRAFPFEKSSALTYAVLSLKMRLPGDYSVLFQEKNQIAILHVICF